MIDLQNLQLVDWLLTHITLYYAPSKDAYYDEYGQLQFKHEPKKVVLSFDTRTEAKENFNLIVEALKTRKRIKKASLGLIISAFAIIVTILAIHFITIL